MARPPVTPVRAILKALSTAEKRERKTFGTIATNNFFPVVALLLGPAGAFLLIVGAFIVLFPLSADPLRKVPRDRLALWPLTPADRRTLRFLSPWLSPMTWVLAALAAWSLRHTESLSLLGLLAVLVAAGFFMPAIGGEPRFLRLIPPFPGALGTLVGKNLREMLCALDFYLALILSLSGALYRAFIPNLPPEALQMMTILVVLALSSYAQCLFGLESNGGRVRYRLMPIAGWRVIAAKDIAYLAVVLVLTLPLSPIAGIAGGLAALAVGRHPSVMEPREQTRWRFTSGAGFGNGSLQVLALASTAATAYKVTTLVLIPAFLAAAGTAWWYGRRIESGAISS